MYTASGKTFSSNQFHNKEFILDDASWSYAYGNSQKRVFE